MKNIPNLVQGNGFTLIVNVTQYTDSIEHKESYDLTDSKWIKAFLMKGTSSYKIEVPCDVDKNNNNILNVYVNEFLPVGYYGLEVIGVTSRDYKWRFKAKPGELFNIVDPTSGYTFPEEEEIEGYISIDATIGIAGLSATQGPVGPQGPKGQDGTVSFDELTPEQIESLRGPQGEVGPQGPQGPKGDTGEVDTSNFYTKTEIDTMIGDVETLLASI